ncbi:acyl-CoA dehydrogenase family protein [Mycobacterium sp. NPDC003449]
MRFTETQIDFAHLIATFCKQRVGDSQRLRSLTNGGVDKHNDEIYAELASMGWLGVGIDEAFGGSGGGLVDRCIFFEQTSKGALPVSGFGTSAIVAGPVARFGTDEQKKRILAGICQGQVCAIAMTEPDAGSDLTGIRTQAKKVDGGYLVNGHKTFISNAHFAAYILVIARTGDPAGSHDGFTMLLVPTDAEGVQVKPLPTLLGNDTNDVYFADCFVSDEAVVGEPGRAWKQLMSGLNGERLHLAAVMLGLAKRSFDYTLNYIRGRNQFGRPISGNQVIQHRIADLATEIRCAELLTYEVAQAIDSDPSSIATAARDSSMAKLKVTEVVKQVTLGGMQMMGGYGYATEYEMEGMVRESLASSVYGGTNEMQRDIIAKTYRL